MKVYYLNRERFSKGDTKIAFEFAKKLILENPNLKILTFLVYLQHQGKLLMLLLKRNNASSQ